MSAAALLQWHYLIFLLPFGVSVLLLTLSAIGAVDGGDGEGGSDSAVDGDGSDADVGDADEGSAGEADSEDEGQAGGKAAPHFLAGLIGIGRARFPSC